MVASPPPDCGGRPHSSSSRPSKKACDHSRRGPTAPRFGRTMRTVDPTITASLSWIVTRSPAGMTASRTRVPFALPASSMPRTGPDWSVVTWIRACSREIMGSSEPDLTPRRAADGDHPGRRQRVRDEGVGRHGDDVKRRHRPRDLLVVVGDGGFGAHLCLPGPRSPRSSRFCLRGAKVTNLHRDKQAMPPDRLRNWPSPGRRGTYCRTPPKACLDRRRHAGPAPTAAFATPR